jgi:hypothetical protein
MVRDAEVIEALNGPVEAHPQVSSAQAGAHRFAYRCHSIEKSNYAYRLSHIEAIDFPR